MGAAVYGPRGQNDAKYWAANATRNGLPVGDKPVEGAVFVKTSGQWGHVGVVTKDLGNGTFKTKEMNGGNVVYPNTAGKTNEFGRCVEHTRTTGPTMKFIYRPGTQPGAWIGHIVQWDGDPKAQKTAWLVGPDGKRRWIPTSDIFYCLKRHGVPGRDPLPPGPRGRRSARSWSREAVDRRPLARIRHGPPCALG